MMQRTSGTRVVVLVDSDARCTQIRDPTEDPEASESGSGSDSESSESGHHDSEREDEVHEEDEEDSGYDEEYLR